ncbi:alpha/beta hydrolase [Arthrobacter sp. LAPM80]|uniref:alpha/beta hydrolase n=1 Tax=Arthrobacter sp. LAPM80 TaxID=3141788 RepID=UPI00398B3B8D
MVGPLRYASYPATDMSRLRAEVRSISGSKDGLATPSKIYASRAILPKGSVVTVIEGALSVVGD